MNGSNQNHSRDKDIEPGIVSRLLDALATLQVPHGLFVHFYIASVLSSGFWAVQLLTQGFAFRAVARHTNLKSLENSMSVDQVALTWALMTVQGVRRLLESIMFTKASSSHMWFAHWLLGITFYLAFGIALWVEGMAALVSADSVYFNITKSAPSLRTIIGIPIFILASGIQHDCHAYLASLPKYTLPMHPIFQVIVCPHYLTECLIYLSLAIIGAPRGVVFNKTILTAFVFVTANLAVTASNNKEWYEKKFGKEAVGGRWKMVPWLF